LAAQDFNEAIRLNPKNAEAHNNRCFTVAAIGDLQPALKDCDEALDSSRNLSLPWMAAAWVNLKLGNISDAI
jgi:tetratricopeptide (TPR) repeat protein